MKISKKTVTHYMLIYIMLVAVGSVKYSEYHDLFIGLNLLVFTIYILKNGKFMVLDRSLAQFIVIGILGAFLCVYSEGSFSISNLLYLISLFSTAYVAFYFCPEKAYERYVKLVVMLATVSLFCFIMSIIGLENVLGIFPLNSQLYMRSISRGGWLYHYMEGYGRNPGIYTEPGLYQMVLLTSMFILFYRMKNIDARRKAKYLIILTATLITAQSTTGYLGLLILAFGIIISKKVEIGTRFKRYALLGTIFVFAIFIIDLNIKGTASFVYTNFLDKLFDSGMKLDLTENTGNARIQCMLADITIFLKNPFGLGFEIYNTVWPKYLAYDIFSSYSSVGLTKSFAIYGFPLAIYILSIYVRGFYKTSKTKIEWLFLTLIYLNTITAQPSICFGCFSLLIYCNKNTNSHLEAV